MDGGWGGERWWITMMGLGSDGYGLLNGEGKSWELQFDNQQVEWVFCD